MLLCGSWIKIKITIIIIIIKEITNSDLISKLKIPYPYQNNDQKKKKLQNSKQPTLTLFWLYAN